MFSSQATVPASDENYKSTLLSLLLETSVLSFGNRKLKSGRISPYSSLLHTASLLRSLASAYTSVLSSPPYSLPSRTESAGVSVNGVFKPTFDILFGPAYKRIPLCAAVVTELAHQGGQFDSVSYSFNRKEAKDHGEGGIIVGAPLKGKRVVVIDDVMTAGTALREAGSIIKKQ